jgi:hypothetical protein
VQKARAKFPVKMERQMKYCIPPGDRHSRRNPTKDSGFHPRRFALINDVQVVLEALKTDPALRKKALDLLSSVFPVEVGTQSLGHVQPQPQTSSGIERLTEGCTCTAVENPDFTPRTIG